jgi:hypothetical protein
MLTLCSLVEVISTYVLVTGAILEHVMDRNEDGSGNSTDRLLTTAPRT